MVDLKILDTKQDLPLTRAKVDPAPCPLAWHRRMRNAHHITICLILDPGLLILMGGLACAGGRTGVLRAHEEGSMVSSLLAGGGLHASLGGVEPGRNWRRRRRRSRSGIR